MYIKKLKDLREDNDLTQNEIAKLLNITQRAYSFYETGDRGIPIEFLIKLADIYKVSLDFLVDRSKTKIKK